MYNKVVDIYCKDPNLLISVFSEMIECGMREEEALSYLYAFCPTKRDASYLRNALPIPWNNIFICPETRNSKNPTSSENVKKYIKWINTFKNMEFDYIIQNPPYSCKDKGKNNGSLHLDFLEKGLNLLTKNGRMVIIEPATFFIDLRKWGKRGVIGRTNSDDILKYDKIKNSLRGHIVKSTLDNLNNPFGTSLQLPFVTTVIDFSKTYDEFEFSCFGEKRTVKDPYDCNLIGDYNTIWSIFDKVLGYNDMLKNHITDKNMGKGMYYTKYIQINPYVGCIVNDGKHDRKSIEKYGYVKNRFGEYLKSYFSGGYFKNMFSENDANQIYDSIPKKLANGATYARPKYSDKNCECVYGSKEELENWEYNLFNTKLMIFICLALTIDQNNHLKDFLPFLVKKKYTDEEINKMFGFTEEEIKLIDRTIKKYERKSLWFKRYMCGPDSVSDKDVNKFINELD